MNAPAKLHEVALDDKYTLASGRVFLIGTHAQYDRIDAQMI